MSERTRTLLPVVVPAASISTLVPRLVDGIVEVLVLRAVGVPEDQIETEQAEVQAVILAKTASRSVLGSMNDFTFMLDRPPRSPGTRWGLQQPPRRSTMRTWRR